MTNNRFAVLLVSLIATPSWAGADLAGGVALIEAGDIEQARTILQAVAAEQPGNAQVAYHLGRTFYAQGDMKEAIDWFERATALDDGESVYFQMLGEAYGTRAGNVGMLKAMRLAGKIKASFQKAVTLDPDNVDARSGLVTFYLNAPGVAGGSEEKALEQVEEIARRDTARGHLTRAWVYESQDKTEEALQEYRAAIQQGLTVRDPYLSLGIFLTGEQRYAEAIEIYDAWLADHPGDLSVMYQVGRTASIAGEFLEQGQQAFERYLAGKPDGDMPSHAWAQYRLGLIHQHRGETDSARAAFEQALKLDPKHKEARRALRKL